MAPSQDRRLSRGIPEASGFPAVSIHLKGAGTLISSSRTEDESGTDLGASDGTGDPVDQLRDDLPVHLILPWRRRPALHGSQDEDRKAPKARDKAISQNDIPRPENDW